MVSEEAVEVAAEATVATEAAEEVVITTRIKTKIVNTTLTLTTTLTVQPHRFLITPTQNLIKRAPEPVRMYQTTRVLVTGRRAGRRPTAPTLWCAAGCTL